jgi:MscS family membrane protein
MNITDYLPFLAQLPEEIRPILLNLILLLLALIVVWVLRIVVTRIIMSPIRRVTERTATDLDDKALAAVERPMRVLVLGVGLALIAATFHFGPELDAFTNSISRALILAAVIFFVYNLVDIIGVTSENLERLTGLHIEDRLLPFMRVVVKVFVLVMGLFIIIQEFGYDVTGLIASFGVVGLAFSLAAQDTAANVFGFTAIVSDNPFEVGDYIITGDIAGTIERVGVRSTRIRKLDQSLVTLPNSSLSDAAVTNWSRLEKRRLDFYLGLTYDTSAVQMREILGRLREMLKARETIDEESVIVHFTEFADSSLNIRIIAYILIADWAEYTAETEKINLEIMEIVEELSLSMAFPSTSVYVETWPQKGLPETQKTVFQAPQIDVPFADETAETGKSEASYQDNPAASSDVDGGDADDAR